MSAVAAGSSAVTPVHPQHRDVLPIPLLAGTPVLKQPIAMRPRRHGYFHCSHLEEELLNRLGGGRQDSSDDFRTVKTSRSLSAMDEKKIVRTAERMIEYANGEWQVTAEMVNKALKVKCCVRVVLSMSRGLCENVRFFI